MSRLDSFIRRLEAQRACLDRAAALIEALDGPVIELGLGNGRTYDHLRERCPGRHIFVCERRVAAHPDCIPAPELLLLGDMRDTLPAVRPRLAGLVALAHLDAGTGDAAASRALAEALGPLIVPLLRIDGILVSESEIRGPGLVPLSLPAGIAAGRYHLYRRSDADQPPIVTITGTWSEALSQPRQSRRMRASPSAPTSDGDTQM